MTWQPKQLNCDVCDKLIDHERSWPTIEVPLTPEDRERLAKDVEKQLPHFPGGIQMFLAHANLIPQKWRIDICHECLTRAFPELDFIKTNQIIQAIEKSEGYRNKIKQASTVALDDD